MPIPLIPILSVVGSLVMLYFYDQKEGAMDTIFQDFQTLVSNLKDFIIVGRPMTFSEFIDLGGWIFFVIGFTVLLVFMLIAFPNPNKKKKRRL